MLTNFFFRKLSFFPIAYYNYHMVFSVLHRHQSLEVRKTWSMIASAIRLEIALAAYGLVISAVFYCP